MKKLLSAVLWLFGTTATIFASVAMAFYLDTGYFMSTKFSIPWPQGGAMVLSDGPTRPAESSNPQIEAQPEVGDARVILVHNFLERHNSPILDEDPEFAQFLVTLADEQGIDFRLLPAIAMQESNLCKVIPPESHNCLGLGIHARGTWGFETYRENFTAAAGILKKNYLDIGLVTPEQIMRKYTPGSNGSWAASVNQWMAEMRYDDRALGRELKTDADLLEFTEENPSTQNNQ